jgi:arginyl-tRNA synthetase
LQEIRESIRKALANAARHLFDLDEVEVPLDYTPRPELGDLASTVAFGLARVLKRPPREIAARLADAADELPMVQRAEVAGGGYLNLFLDRTAVLRRLLDREQGDPVPSGAKCVVEHTNINPNKAAHIGHLRNAVLGDSLVRCLRALGRPVEVQNYIDDTGVQVADLVVGFRRIEGLDLRAVRELEQREEERCAAGPGGFDYYCWDLYARVTAWYAGDPARESHRSETLHAMESGEGEDAEMAAFLAPRMVRAHLRTMERLGIRYDLLPKESDILRHGFWERTFAALRDSGAIHRAEGGKNEGCWVLPLPPDAEGAAAQEKVLVRSNGTVTYTGKDIAYQLWKLGLLGLDFEYRLFPLHQPAEDDLWETTTGEDAPAHPEFAGGHVVYNVIDSRQRYPQQVVAQGVRLLGHPEAADRSIHFWYDMVALSPRTAEALVPGLELTGEERERPFLEMAGRRGIGVKADDLLDRLEEKALAAVRANDASLTEADAAARARQVSVGALRYYMLRTTRSRVVALDIDDALAFTGETGPYLQYAVVRVLSIHDRLHRETDMDAGARAKAVAAADFAALDDEDDALAHWEIVARCARLEETIASSVRSLELSQLAHYAFDLARSFSSFYQAKDASGRTRFPVVQEADAARRALRLAITELFRRTLARALALMGIPVPERM